MKARLNLALCLATLLCCTASSIAQAGKRLDVALEGPWILYEDHQFMSGKKKVSVLIAMAPYPDPKKPHHHNVPTFSAGDGYEIPAGISCVGFDKVCAPKRKTKTLSNDGYAKTELLQIKLSSSVWNWAAKANPDPKTATAVYLILPMPDSYSSDGVYYMHFAAHFDVDGAGYGDAGKDPVHTIGVHLHYQNGPTKLYLGPCQTDSPPNASSCASWKEERSLDNTGTLRITMKAPDSNYACDNHVRSAYPEMLKLLDTNDLAANSTVSYIDPATAVKNGAGDYSRNKECRACDPQNPPVPNTCNEGMTPTVPPTLAEIVNQLRERFPCPDNAKNCPDDPYRKLVLFDQLNQELNQLDLDPRFPRLSQLSWIAKLLRDSANGIGTLLLDEKTLSSGKIDKVPLPLRTIQTGELNRADDLTKSGGDCRAPLILATPATSQ
ncbi:MAG TPA: hypothetical protein VN950_02225 [Terriglobales bacterium]|nr:hypothetical protein [Terriglobales bacterium]